METGPITVFLDTHAAVFLAEGRRDAFGQEARILVEQGSLFVSPMVRLELAFLFEVGRIKLPPEQILGVLMAECGVSQADDSFAAVVEQASELTWTRDPFDRLLVATAALHQAPFITRDRNIRGHYPPAVW